MIKDDDYHILSYIIMMILIMVMVIAVLAVVLMVVVMMMGLDCNNKCPSAVQTHLSPLLAYARTIAVTLLMCSSIYVLISKQQSINANNIH